MKKRKNPQLVADPQYIEGYSVHIKETLFLSRLSLCETFEKLHKTSRFVIPRIKYGAGSAKAGIKYLIHGSPFLRGRRLDSRLRDCVVIGEYTNNIVIPAKAGIQNLLKILDSVSRFACTE
jgi:hypothetical protein